MDAPTRADAAALDARDPLAHFVDRFVVPDPEACYLDGNSLGRLPRATAARLRSFVDGEWAGELVEGWDHWIDLPIAVGNEIARTVLGAGPAQVMVCDSVTVNLYKLAVAVLEARPDRTEIVTAESEFPTDRYVLEGVAARLGRRLRWLPVDPDWGVTADAVAATVDRDCALLCLSAVDFRSGARADVAEVTRLVHRADGLVLWDLSHAAGSVPLTLDADEVDLAVGCTYKYLNAGPGAPAYLYVRRDLQAELRQPIWGWFGQRDQFAMGPTYDPEDGIRHFLTGTPNVLGTVAVQEGVRLYAEAGIDAVRAKSRALTSLMVALTDAWLRPLGFELASPTDPERLGAHISVSHPEAGRISRALRERAKVIPDFRPPDQLRLGPAPLSTRFVEVWDGLDRLRRLVARGEHLEVADRPMRVT
jgi:kynureninase